MISVCMATYNGEHVILRQINSILKQLNEKDELIVVDDGSSDATVEYVRSLNDSRIKVYQNESTRGPIGSFQRALMISRGELIFLSDQDDIWQPNKVLTAKKDFKKMACDVWTHDSIVKDADLNVIAPSWNKYNHNVFSGGNIRTILKNPYTGSMMAFSRHTLDLAMPFPEKITMHDQWIGMVAQREKLAIYHSNDILMQYIRYGNNVTSRRKKSIVKMVKSRLNMMKYIILYNK